MNQLYHLIGLLFSRIQFFHDLYLLNAPLNQNKIASMNVPKRTWPSWLENKFFSSVKKLRPIARKMVTHINFGRYQINGRLVPIIDVLQGRFTLLDATKVRIREV